MNRRYSMPLLGIVIIAAYYLALTWLVFRSSAGCQFTGACDETGRTYGFWSGFGGTVLFSAMILAPPWYLQHTCHSAWWCLRWGHYEAAGGVFKVCRFHHPDLQGQRPHGELIKRLHHEWKRQQ